MPELPEVETVRAGVAEHVRGCIIRSVRVHDNRSLRRHNTDPEDFTLRLAGCRITGAHRRGKYMWLTLDDADGEPAPYALVIHLGMSGQLLVKTNDFPVEKHLKVVLELSETNRQLRFVDQRIFGGMFLDELVDDTPAGQHSAARFLVPASVKHIARDPLDEFFDPGRVRTRFLRTASGVKRLLLDQSVISGVGNIYADEALWRAKLHYDRPAKTLSAAQFRALMKAVQEVMGEALAAGGTSFDALYVNINGQSGYFDRSLNAYSQAGAPCPRCLAAGRTSLIVREPFMGRSSYRCPHCQRTPRGAR